MTLVSLSAERGKEVALRVGADLHFSLAKRPGFSLLKYECPLLHEADQVTELKTRCEREAAISWGNKLQQPATINTMIKVVAIASAI